MFKLLSFSTLVTSLLLPAAAAAQPSSPYGINVHAPGGEQRELLFDRVREAGVGWIRIDFVWAAIEMLPGLYDWEHYDGLVAAAEERGLQILAIIAYTPDWATDGPEIAGVPRSEETWRRFCRRAAERYDGRIRAWEIWNEPNLDHFWAGTRQQYVDRILLPGAAALRSGSPQALVAGPGLAHLVSGDRDWYRWLLEVVQAAGAELDVLTHHAYDRDGHREVTDKLNAATLFGDRPELWDVVSPSLREVLELAGWSGPVWLTETGWASDEVGESRQASHVTGILEQWLVGDEGRDWIAKLFFYELVDDPTPGVPAFGLLRADLSEKSAFDAYRDFVERHPVVDRGSSLELLGGRFSIEVTWRDHGGGEGGGTAVPLTESTGTFWFFEEANTELLVKVLDGRPLNDHFWLYYGALSDVEYRIVATDRLTGVVRTYVNPAGNLCGLGDVVAFPDGDSSLVPLLQPPAAIVDLGTVEGCGGSALCLREERFRVEVSWRDPRTERRGIGTPVPWTSDTGLFWFFDADNVELAVKVLDGRSVNGRFWVFFGALSDVEYDVTVTDQESGAVRRYRNPAGELCGRADTEAF